MLVPKLNKRQLRQCSFSGPFGKSCRNGAFLPQTVHYPNQTTLCLQHPFLRRPVIAQVLIPRGSWTRFQRSLVNPPSRFTTRMMITTLQTIGREFGWPLALYTTVPDAYVVSQRDDTRACR